MDVGSSTRSLVDVGSSTRSLVDVGSSTRLGLWWMLAVALD